MKLGKLGQFRFREMQQTLNLRQIRILMLVPLVILIIECIHMFDLMYFLYYDTFWGLLISTYSIYCSLQAAKHPVEWQKTTIVTSEISLALNLQIALSFWSLMACNEFSNLSWEGVDLYLRITLFLLYSMPLFLTTVNVVLTDMTFLLQDWKLVVIPEILYVFANLIGSYALDHRINFIEDWGYPIRTLFVFVLKGALMAGIHVFSTNWMKKFKVKQH